MNLLLMVETVEKGKQQLPMTRVSSSSLRRIFILAILAIVVLILVVLGQLTQNPRLDDIYPRIGGPGDILVLEGQYFGNDQGTVFVSGERISQQAFLEWSDRRISLRIPDGMRSGLVILENSRGRSNGLLYAHRSHVPVPLPIPDPGTVPPPSLSSRSSRRGQVITVSSSQIPSFPRNYRLLLTSSNGESRLITPRIWVAGSISFSVPLWAESGTLELWSGDQTVFSLPMEVLPPRGLQNPGVTPANTHDVPMERKWNLRYGFVGSFLNQDQGTQDKEMESRLIPVFETALPLIRDRENQLISYRDVSVHSDLVHRKDERYSILTAYRPFDHEFWNHGLDIVVTVREIRHDFVENQVQLSYAGLEEEALPWLELDTRVISTGDSGGIQAIRSRGAAIVARNTNPLRKTRLVYDWVRSRLSPLFTLETPSITEVFQDAELNSLVSHGSYGYSLLTTALVRSVNVPARIIGGLLILDYDEVLPHYWVEALLPEIGWIPLDVSLADGLFQGQSFIPESRVAYYFGNLDTHHIAFGPIAIPYNSSPYTPTDFPPLFAQLNPVIRGSETARLTNSAWVLPVLGPSHVDTPPDTLYSEENSP